MIIIVPKTIAKIMIMMMELLVLMITCGTDDTIHGHIIFDDSINIDFSFVTCALITSAMLVFLILIYNIEHVMILTINLRVFLQICSLLTNASTKKRVRK